MMAGFPPSSAGSHSRVSLHSQFEAGRQEDNESEQSSSYLYDCIGVHAAREIFSDLKLIPSGPFGEEVREQQP